MKPFVLSPSKHERLAFRPSTSSGRTVFYISRNKEKGEYWFPMYTQLWTD